MWKPPAVTWKTIRQTIRGGKTMPEFVNPFSGKVPDRKLTLEELIRAIRLNIAAEHEAVHLYMAHADATDHPLAKEVLVDIANEERVHAGEFQRLLEILTGDEDRWMAEGREEVDEIAAKVGATGEAGGTEAPAASGEVGQAFQPAEEETTIGSLKE
jgi:rubrerythrin